MSTLNQNNSHLPQVKITDNSTFSPLRFPHDVGKYYITFSFADYAPQYVGALSAAANLISQSSGAEFIYNGLAGGINFLANTDIQYLEVFKNLSTEYSIGIMNAQVVLPVPVNLLDDQQLDYNAFNMINTVTSLAMQAGKQSNVLESVYNFGSIATGMAVNPFMALMFNGPKFKTHQFGWRFSPKTDQETKSITAIFNLFKKKSLPKFKYGNSVFVYPSVVGVMLHPENARNNMYTFKPAVVTQVSIHHAPSGTPSFFAGSNAPVEIELKLQLTEMSIWTQEDYKDADK